ncbi:MAG: WXG100 family type VII secretion target [Anaerolineales bacterium]|nr:WXG100 family type VII secretion target [Anaerolineales bacterium]
MAEIIQVKYDEIGQLASMLNQQADEMQALYQKIASKTEDLSSSWIGRGADAFQQEMHEIVLPALKRLYESLGQASSAMGALSSHWQSIEDEATTYFPTE